MDYKTVMVGLALDRPNDACLRVAGDIAERFGARIIGVAASDLRPPMYFAEGDFAQKLLDEEASAIESRLSELEAEFRASVERRATAVEWRSARTFPVPYLLQQVRAADILVIGARSETLVDPNAAPDPSDLLMQAGRPLIVVPPAVQWLDLRSVLIAWKDVREARRAVFDALPILAAAKEITIAEIPEEDGGRADALSHVADVAAWLRGHGITANTVVPDKAGGVTGQLEDIAANVGTGAVIAGAYGHSRFREWYSAALRAILQLNRAAARSCLVKDLQWRGAPVHKFLEATAGQYMTRKVKTVARDTTMRELHKMFEADDFNCYPVREGDDIVGVVSNFDFLKCFAFNPGCMVPAYDDLLSRMVVDVMTPEFIYVDPATKLTRVLQLMVDHRMKSVPVLDAEQRLAGIIAREDIMRALTESARG